MPPKKKTVERKEYYCHTPCWHMGKRWHKGQVGLFASDELPTDPKGKETRHFAPVNPELPPPVVEEGPVEVDGKKRPEK